MCLISLDVVTLHYKDFTDRCRPRTFFGLSLAHFHSQSACKLTAGRASYAVSSYNIIIILALFFTEEILIELTSIPTLESASEKLTENL